MCLGGASCSRRRNDEDPLSFWVTGKREAFWMFVLYRDSFTTSIQVAKIAGYLTEPRRRMHSSFAVEQGSSWQVIDLAGVAAPRHGCFVVQPSLCIQICKMR